ncbi:MAG: hypothetical protein J0I06_08240 [Planctomycetes bacterium]|nr:hypothetical protein [Planctomycetota bacterium]
MVRSVAPIGPGAPAGPERFDPDAHPEFERFGARYRAEATAGGLTHVEETRDRSGAVATRVAEPMAYAIGSGTHARSYLFERDGAVFQSPVTWYSGPGRWDGSPGYRPDWHFNRPVPADCLFCHANAVEPVEGTVNRYRAPLFRGGAIGCERCHGPGALHVSAREAGPAAGEDHTIVNPARLLPPLREAVCEQCHLAGRVRVLRDGRGPFDYRPGLPIHLFWSIFEFPGDLEGNVGRVAGHTEQMHASRCYRASEGRLGCASCHDPHRKPSAADAPVEFRTACVKCHAPAACRGPAAERQATRPADNCAGCHMPRSPTPGVGHVALTDHRVLRRPAAAPGAGAGMVLKGADTLALFHRGQVADTDRGVRRDLGLALVTLARARTADPAKHQAAQRHLAGAALPLLEEALARRPGDVAARDARGGALALLGRPAEALDELAAALVAAPEREYTLLAAMTTAGDLGREAEALGFAERAALVNPSSPDALSFLAAARGTAGDWAGAVAAADAGLRLNPADVQLRTVRIQGYLRTGRADAARADYLLLSRVVSNPDALLQWFKGAGGTP